MSESHVPEDLRYTGQHEWVRLEGTEATVGITDFAQHALGEVTYVELPEVGTEVAHGGELAVVESLKAASDVYAPVAGRVLAVNSALEDEPKRINENPYGEGWLCKLVGVDSAGLDALLTAAQYRQLLEQEKGQA